MTILGITGGIATGKSTVTQMFADLGAPTASADAIARDLLAPGTPTTSLVAADFPQAVSSTAPLTLDRRALSAIVFSDEAARKRLEAILHPQIIAELTRWVEAMRSATTSRVAAVEIPLLFETGLERLVDKIVVASVDEETQLTRLQERLGIDRTAALQQLAAQWPLSCKIEKADVVIDTGRSSDTVRDQVREIFEAS